jgi:hypothetical protein
MDFNGLHPQLRPYAELLLREASKAGIRCVITSVRRSFEEQSKLYAKYLRGENPYPVAKPGTSAHETGLAFDVDCRWPDGKDAAPVVGSNWNRWGGRWSRNDRVHFTV